MSNALKVDFNQNDDKRNINIDNLTDTEIAEISDFYAKLINALQEKMGYPTTYRAYAAQDTLEHSKRKAKAYEARVLTQLKLVTSKIILVLKIWHLSNKSDQITNNA